MDSHKKNIGTIKNLMKITEKYFMRFLSNFSTFFNYFTKAPETQRFESYLYPCGTMLSQLFQIKV